MPEPARLSFFLTTTGTASLRSTVQNWDSSRYGARTVNIVESANWALLYVSQYIIWQRGVDGRKIRGGGPENIWKLERGYIIFLARRWEGRKSRVILNFHHDLLL